MLKTLFAFDHSVMDDPWWDGHQPWWNRCYEYCGTRIRFMAGDLSYEGEKDHGSPSGLRFSVDIELCQEDIPEFYLPDNPDAKYDIHALSVMFWRWGIYFSVRGRVRS